MAFLSEDIDNPLSYADYPDVLRLETDNKVYGGKYTTGAEDEGISNLQAMQLMERDDYILRRVNQPSVAPVGDTPGKPGIAGLGTDGKISDSQIPAAVTRNDSTQTLINKTIAISSNNITGTANRMVQTDANGKLTTTSASSDDYLTTSNTQTVTNKTMAIGSNTITGTADKLVVTDSNGRVITSDTATSAVATLSGTQTFTNKTMAIGSNTITGTADKLVVTDANGTVITSDIAPSAVATLSGTQTFTNKTVDGYYNTIKLSPTYARDTATITFPGNAIIQLYFDSASTGGPYTISDGPYNGYTLQITVSSAGAANAVISFKSAVDSGTTVQKTLSAGVHHLTWQEATGWTFYELSGVYQDSTTFTFLI